MKDLENLATVTIVIVVYTIIFVASIIIGAAQGEILTVTNKPEQPPYKRSSHEFPVKIIDSKLVEYREEGPYIIETYAQVVEMGKPRLSDLIENSKDYFNFIESTYGESGRRMIKAKIKEWEEFVARIFQAYLILLLVGIPILAILDGFLYRRTWLSFIVMFTSFMIAGLMISSIPYFSLRVFLVYIYFGFIAGMMGLSSSLIMLKKKPINLIGVMVLIISIILWILLIFPWFQNIHQMY